jgi:sarcosine oxidase subunit gamma
MEPNTVTQGGAATLFWLGPDEWQVQTPAAQCAPLLGQLRTVLAGRLAAVTDVSDGHTVIVLEDPRAGELLSRGCPLDFHPAAFPVGNCAQSVFGKTGVLLLREAPQRFALVVRRSFTPYLYHALQDAAAVAAG